MQESISECIIDRTIIFRADGNLKIGFGHIYRMLALIEMIGPVSRKIIFITQPLPELISRLLAHQKIHHIIVPDQDLDVPDKQNGLEVRFDMELKGDEIVVLDGYHFGIDYQKNVKRLGNKLIYIDDLGGDKFIADIVINHAPGVKYSYNKVTQFYTGLDYAMLRMPFFRPVQEKCQNDKVAYVCMGGSDYYEYSLLLLEQINSYGGFNAINLVYSSKYPEKLIEKLNTFVSNVPLNLYSDVNAEELVSLLDKSTHAFVSASTVLLECYSRGLFCYTGYYTKNQYMIYNGFINKGLACGLGDFSSLDSEMFKNALSETPNKLSEHLNSVNLITEIFNRL